MKPQSSYLEDGDERKIAVPEKEKEPLSGSLEKVESSSIRSDSGRRSVEEPPLGEIFGANVFGHYLLTHELMPLLSTSRAGRVEGDRGRIIWISTLEPNAEDLPMNDLQGLTSKNPYYGSKRLTDLLSLTAKLPAVRSINSDFFHLKNYALPPYRPLATTSEAEAEITCEVVPEAKQESQSQGRETKPEIYVCQPGVVNTNISGMNWFQGAFMLLGFYMARLLGSVWFPIKPYPAAVAPVWLGLSDQSLLDSLETSPETPPGSSHGDSSTSSQSSSHDDHYRDGDRDLVRAKCKWGSSADRLGNERVRKTEVPGWGWSGRVGETIEQKGRAGHAKDLSREAREDFEGDGRYCWTYMEGLRRAWEQRLDVGDAIRK